MSKIKDAQINNPLDTIPNKRLTEAQEEKIRSIFNAHEPLPAPDYEWYNNHPTAE